MAKSTTVDWAKIADSKEFRLLLISKARFIIPATLFFVIYYFALPISVGYFPEFMSRKVIGPVNIAYLFALSQFFMAWIIAALYVRAAAKFDIQAHALVGHLKIEELPMRRASGIARRTSTGLSPVQVKRGKK